MTFSERHMDGEEFLGFNEELNEQNLHRYEKLADDDAIQEDEAEKGDDDETSSAIMVPRIVNIVACVDYGCEIDLFKIATHARNAENTPKRFPAVTLRIQDPNATGLTFKNGKMNIVGCRTEESAFLAARKFGRILKNLGFPVKLKSFTIANMVATMTVRKQNMYEATKGGFTNATDAADWLVKQGVPFRDSHAIIGQLVLYCINNNTSLADLSLEEYKAISPVFDESVYDAIKVEKCVEARNVIPSI